MGRPETPNIATAETTKRNKPLTSVVLFTGCKVSGRNCNIRVDFTVLKPDGTNYGSQKDVTAWVNRPGAPKGVIQVSEASLRVVIEPNDPAEIHRQGYSSRPERQDRPRIRASIDSRWIPGLTRRFQPRPESGGG